jgi:carboxymethylenebutenolidase
VTAPVLGHAHSHGPANRRRRVLSTAAPLYLVAPRGPVRGGLVLLHDRAGLTGEIERCAQRLAGDGWLVVAPYHYYDTGGRVYADPAQAPRPTEDSLRADVRAALDHLVARRGLPATRLAVVGVGAGGRLAGWAARTCELAAAAAVDRPALDEPEVLARCLWADLSTPDPDWAGLRRFLRRFPARPHPDHTTGPDEKDRR